MLTPDNVIELTSAKNIDSTVREALRTVPLPLNSMNRCILNGLLRQQHIFNQQKQKKAA